MSKREANHEESDPLDAGLEAFFRDHSLEPPATAQPLPDRLGDFELVEEIGRGGMGVVYIATQAALGRRVALKVLAPHLTRSADDVHRFRREAASAARLRHASIAQVFCAGEDAGHHFIAMELVDGAPLDRVLDDLRCRGLDRLDGSSILTATAKVRDARGSPDAPRTRADAHRERRYLDAVCLLVASLADALQHAHDAGVVHRDVKPSNVIVRSDGVPVLTDFGLAHADDLGGVTRTGVFAGTPHYCSPEQADPGSRPVDHRSDVFSLGVTLFELLTLRRPFEGNDRRVLERIANEDAPGAGRFNRRLPTDLRTIVAHVLEREPARRYPTAAALAADLRAFVAMRPIAARRASPATITARFVRRHRVSSALAALAAVVAAGVTTWSLHRPGRIEVDSHPPGATVWVDGLLRGSTPCSLTLPPGPVEIRLEDADDGLFGSIETYTVQRGPNRFSQSLQRFEQVVQLACAGDAWATTLLARPTTALRERMMKRRDDDFELLRRAAAEGKGDWPVTRELCRELELLDPDRTILEQAESLLDAARLRTEQLTHRRGELMAAIDAAPESAELDAVLAGTAVLRAERLGSYPFEPAVKCADSIEARSVERVRNLAAVEVDVSHLDALLGILTGMLPPDTSAVAEVRARRDALRASGELRQHHERALHARTVTELESLWNAMTEIDPDHPWTREVRRLREQRLRAQRAAESERELLQRACEAFDGEAAETLERVRLDAESFARATTHGDGNGSSPLVVAIERARGCLGLLDAARGQVRDDPDAALTALLAGWTPPTLAELQHIADRKLAGLRSLAEAVRVELTICAAFEAVALECRRMDVAAARDALARLHDLPTTTVDDLDVTPRAAGLVAALEQAERDVRLDDETFARFREQLRLPDAKAAGDSLRDLEPRWRTRRAQLTDALALAPRAALLLERARLSARLGDLDAAEDDATTALGLRRTPGALVACGSLRFLGARDQRRGELRGMSAALDLLDEALQVAPGDPAALYWRGVIQHEIALCDPLRKDECYRDAREDLVGAMDGGLRSADACYRLASLAEALRQPAEVVAQWAGRALTMPLAEADLLAALGCPRSALTKSRYFDRDVFLIRADARFELERYGESVEDCDRAIRLDPVCADVWFRRGSSQWMLGDRTAGLASMERARDLAEVSGDGELERLAARLLESWR